MRVYLCVVLGAFIFCAYWAGIRIGAQRCRATVAESVVHAQAQTMQTLGDINEKVFNTAVRDIRRVLREKYTIAQ